MKRTIISIAIAILAWGNAWGCTNLIVTRGASADGSNMVTYAADSHTRYGFLNHLPAAKYPAGALRAIYEYGPERYLGQIPEAARTFNVVGNINEHQLIIGESTWGGLTDHIDPKGILDYGSLMYIALQRCTTAREAITLIAKLADEYGYASSGESISIADKQEAWILEIIAKRPEYNEKGENLNKGVVWVAARIPDGYISAHANAARITTIALNDPDNYMYAEDLFEYVRRAGLYDGAPEEFSFADTFCPLDFSLLRGCEARVWAFFNKFGAEDMGRYLDFVRGDNPANRMPLYVKPARKLSLKDVADMMRDHYEGTEFDMTQDPGAGGHSLPYRWRPMGFEVDGEKYSQERAIATQQTGFWFVAQSRGWLPDPVGGVIWFGVDDAATSPLTPVYCCATEVSDHYAFGQGNMVQYSPISMFWLVNRVAQFCYLRYNQVGAEVRSVVDAHEMEMMERVAAADAMATAMSPRKAVKYLTRLSVEAADELFYKWKTLDEYLLVKYIDGNTKQQNPDGSFKTNGHNDFVPAKPMFPGYDKQFLDAIGRSEWGKRLKER